MKLKYIFFGFIYGKSFYFHFHFAVVAVVVKCLYLLCIRSMYVDANGVCIFRFLFLCKHSKGKWKDFCIGFFQFVFCILLYLDVAAIFGLLYLFLFGIFAFICMVCCAFAYLATLFNPTHNICMYCISQCFFKAKVQKGCEIYLRKRENKM